MAPKTRLRLIVAAGLSIVPLLAQAQPAPPSTPLVGMIVGISVLFVLDIVAIALLGPQWTLRNVLHSVRDRMAQKIVHRSAGVGIELEITALGVAGQHALPADACTDFLNPIQVAAKRVKSDTVGRQKLTSSAGLPVAAALKHQPKERTMKIVVIGGTGLIGSKLVSALSDMGHSAVAASPNTGVNTLTGEGLQETLAGAQVVVDVSNSPSFEEKPVMEFFKTSTTNLLEAERAAGVGHHVALCIVGTDQLQESPYFRAKKVQETLIQRSRIPYTILRSTQFFEFISRIALTAPDGKSLRASSAYIQPVVSDDVVAALADIAVGTPANGIVEIAGPERFHLDELVRQIMKATGDARDVITDVSTRYFGALLGERTLTSDSPNIVGTTHFADWAAYTAARAPTQRRAATAPSVR